MELLILIAGLITMAAMIGLEVADSLPSPLGELVGFVCGTSIVMIVLGGCVGFLLL